MYGFGYRYSPNGIYVPSGGGALDPDADAFLTAATITDPTEISAVNQLVIDMKDAGIWTKMKAVYPIVGGTATTQKWNLIDPNTYAITFAGGWVHSSTGMLGNGINTTGDTQLTPITDMPGPDMSMGVYMRDQATATNRPLLIGGTSQNLYYMRYGPTNITAYMPNLTTPMNNSISPATKFMATAKNGVDLYFTMNGLGGFNSSTTSSPNMANSSMKIGNLGSTYAAQEFAFVFIGYYLDPTEMDIFRGSVNTFQTTLGRAV